MLSTCCFSNQPGTSTVFPGKVACLISVLQSVAVSVNIPSAGQATEMDFVGIVSGKQHDKFAAAGLIAVKAEKVDAPYGGENITVD